MRRLTRSDYIFSGIKTFHELNEAFPSLLDENGNRKPFEQFLNDVRKIDETYNEHYLRAEYNFVQQSANMAAKWEDFHEETDHEEAMSLGEEALQEDKKGLFRFNSGKEGKTMPDYNPYTIKRCRDCDVAKGDVTLALVPENELCEACKMLHVCERDRDGVISKHRERYLELKDDVNYTDVRFDERGGGLTATHVRHNFDPRKGQYEKSAQTAGYKGGHSVILEEERHDILNHRNTEGTWDDELFEVAGAETATSANIRNALKHCASKPNCKVAVLVFPKERFSAKAFKDGLRRYYGLKDTPQYKKFHLIYCVQDDEIILTKKPSD